MLDDITGLCRDHSFETATAMCRRCSLEFCDLCVVYPFGPKKPLCKECAMAAGEPTPPPVLIDPTMQESAPDSDPIAATVPAGSSMAGDFLDQVPDAPLPPPPPPAAAGEPTDGVAPPIDWNQPFG